MAEEYIFRSTEQLWLATDRGKLKSLKKNKNIYSCFVICIFNAVWEMFGLTKFLK